MTHYLVLGASHQRTAVELREKLAFSSEEVQRFLPLLLERAGVQEAALLSTCNRVEIYFVTDTPEQALSHLSHCLTTHKGRAAATTIFEGYQLRNRDVVLHLFRVAAGLESQLVGEPQILGQVKDSYNLAHTVGTTGIFLNRLFTMAIQCGKRVRHDTAIGEGAISIGSATVQLLAYLHDDIKNINVVLIGAGEMAAQAALQLTAKGKGTVKLHIASRRRGHAQELAAKAGAESFALENFPAVLAAADAVIAATSSQKFILTPQMLDARARTGKPLLCIDIGVPRNIDPAIAQLPSVRLHNIDHLNGIIDKNLQSRQSEIPRAEAIVQDMVAEFAEWYHSQKVVPIIKSLLRYAEAIRRREMERSQKKFRPEQWEHLNLLTESLSRKLLHLPIQRLKEWANDPTHDNEDLKAICDFFALGENLIMESSPSANAAGGGSMNQNTS